jgi:hypothetical protein
MATDERTRPRFQFSLRTLMGFVTLTIVFFSMTYSYGVMVGIGVVGGVCLVLSGLRRRRRGRSVFGVILCGIGLLLTQFDDYTTHVPPAAEVVGFYSLASQRVSSNGVAATETQPCNVELRIDGTFTRANLPSAPFRSPELSTLVTCSGKWHIAIVSNDGDGTAHWGIRFDSQPAVKSAHLVGRSAPYALKFVIGDPDCGVYMRFKRIE